MPRRDRQGATAPGRASLGPAAPGRAVAGDGRCVDLRAGPGRSQPGTLGHEVFSWGSRVMLETNAAAAVSTVTFTLNGKTAVGRADRTILQTAQAEGVEIPRLCYMEGMRADGNCRTCMVEIKGERVLAPSCCRYPKDGMEVTTNSARGLTSQKMSIELLLADVPEASYTRNSELDRWARKLGVGKPRFGARPQPTPDLSHPAMAVHLDACIQCTRCVRACREEQVNDVIGTPFAAPAPRSCSISEIQWARRPAWLVANACKPVQPARSRRRMRRILLRSTASSRRCAPIAASVVSLTIMSTTIASSASRAAMGQRITIGCASKGDSGPIMSII